MFQDEARFGRISDTRRCWCPKPVRPLCQAMVVQEYTYAYAAVSVADGRLDTLILPRVNRRCMQLFLDEVASRHPGERIVMVLDGAVGIAATPLRWHPMCACLACRRTRPNSIRSSIFGMTYGRNPSTTASSKAWTRWKIIWKGRSMSWNLTIIASIPSSLGPGL